MKFFLILHIVVSLLVIFGMLTNLGSNDTKYPRISLNSRGDDSFKLLLTFGFLLWELYLFINLPAS